MFCGTAERIYLGGRHSIQRNTYTKTKLRFYLVRVELTAYVH